MTCEFCGGALEGERCRVCAGAPYDQPPAKYCELCGGRLANGRASPCFHCVRSPDDRAPIPGALYDTDTGEIKPPTIEGALNQVPRIGFHHVNGETYTLVCMEDVRKALKEFQAAPDAAVTTPGA